MALGRLAIITGMLISLSSFNHGVSAQSKPNAQNHHCKLPDGSMDMSKTHKQCTEAKGQWTKDATSAVKSSPGTTPPTATPSK
jgi:hypothetical protein